MTHDLYINALPAPWTKRQYQFALHYLADPKRGARAAAIKAGYAAKSAHVHATRMLNKAKFLHIQEYIALRLQEATKDLETNADRTLNHQAAIAFSNIMNYFGFEDGKIHVDLENATPEQLSAIASIEVIHLTPLTLPEGQEREVLKTKIKLWDKGRALEALMKHHGLLKEKVEISGKMEMTNIELARRIAFLLRAAAEKQGK